MCNIACTTVRRSAACLWPRLPDALNTGSSKAHWSSVRSLGYDMPRTVTTGALTAIGTHPVRASWTWSGATVSEARRTSESLRLPRRPFPRYRRSLPWQRKKHRALTGGRGATLCGHAHGRPQGDQDNDRPNPRHQPSHVGSVSAPCHRATPVGSSLYPLATSGHAAAGESRFPGQPSPRCATVSS